MSKYRKPLTVSEDVEIILDGKKFLLEKGDKVVLEESLQDFVGIKNLALGK